MIKRNNKLGYFFLDAFCLPAVKWNVYIFTSDLHFESLSPWQLKQWNSKMNFSQAPSKDVNACSPWRHHTDLPSVTLTSLSLAWRRMSSSCQPTPASPFSQTLKAPLELLLLGEFLHPQIIAFFGSRIHWPPLFIIALSAVGYRWQCTWVERLREIQLRFW